VRGAIEDFCSRIGFTSESKGCMIKAIYEKGFTHVGAQGLAPLRYTVTDWVIYFPEIS